MKRFRPNGCTLFPEGKQTSCCNSHDMSYIFGRSRKKADNNLKECIENCNKPIMARIVYAGVRAFGYPFWVIAKRKLKKARKRNCCFDVE